MPYSAVAALMILTTVLLSACAQQKLAALEDRSHEYFGRNAALVASHANALFVPSFNDARTAPAAAFDNVSSVDLPPPAAALPPASAQMAAQKEPLSAPPMPGAAANLGWRWPVEGEIIAKFGKLREGIANQGITIAAAEGAPIHAVADGEVAYVGENVRDYGNMVILRHANNEMTSYAHAARISVAKGMTVKQGDTIGYVGTSGHAARPQLHFAVRSGAETIDPLSKLPQSVAALQ